MPIAAHGPTGECPWPSVVAEMLHRIVRRTGRFAVGFTMRGRARRCVVERSAGVAGGSRRGGGIPTGVIKALPEALDETRGLGLLFPATSTGCRWQHREMKDASSD